MESSSIPGPCRRLCSLHLLCLESRAHLGRRAIAMLLDQPLPAVLVFELEQGQAQLLDAGEVADPEQLLLEGSDEALGISVALGLVDEGRAGFDAVHAARREARYEALEPIRQGVSFVFGGYAVQIGVGRRSSATTTAAEFISEDYQAELRFRTQALAAALVDRDENAGWPSDVSVLVWSVPQI